MATHTLIQLVGGQMMPNIFPALSIKPEVIVNICTSDSQGQAEQIERWFRKCGVGHGIRPGAVRTVNIGNEDMLDKTYEVCMDIVQDRLAAGQSVVLNNTGGTKLMAIGAQRAMEENGQPCVYVDTPKKALRVVSLAKPEVEGEYGNPFDCRLGIRELLRANGNVIVDYRTDWEKYKQAAKFVYQKMRFLCMQDFPITDLNHPYGWEKDMDYLAKPVAELLQTKNGKGPDYGAVLRTEEAKAVLASEDVKLFEIRNGELYFPLKLVNKYKKARHAYGKACSIAKKNRTPENEANKAEAQKNLRKAAFDIQNAKNFLEGGWWEVLVAWYMEKTEQADTILWSVNVSDAATDREQNYAAETDVIVQNGLSLMVTSCKRSTNHLVELLAHQTRTKELGGVFAKARLAVYRIEEENFFPIAKKLGIKYLTGAEVEEALGDDLK